MVQRDVYHSGIAALHGAAVCVVEPGGHNAANVF